MSKVVYGWTGGAEGEGLPFPIADQSSPNAARDIQALAERIMIDADNADLTGLPTTGQPLAFYGSGRPDAAGLDLSAPTGSIYTFAGDQSELDAVFGARGWRKGPSDWYVTEGDTGWRNFLGYSGAGGATSIDAGVSLLTHRMRRINNLVQIATRATVTARPEYNTLLFVVAGGWQPDADEWSSAGVQNHTGSSSPFSYSLGLWDVNGRITWRQPDYTTNPGTKWDYNSRAINTRPWPTELPDPVRTLDELRELIEEIEAEGESHPQWDTLQQLREELAELTGTKPGDVS